MTADDGTTTGDGVAGRQVAPLPSDPAGIEALIAERRADLASTIDELVVRAHPQEIARRSAADVRARVRAFAVADDGQLRIERLLSVAVAGAAVFGVMLLLRRRRR